MDQKYGHNSCFKVATTVLSYVTYFKDSMGYGVRSHNKQVYLSLLNSETQFDACVMIKTCKLHDANWYALHPITR